MKANIWNHSEWVAECNPAVLVQELGGMLSRSGFHILDYVEHHFQPQGFTALWLLGESHLAVHTFPEFGRAYLELSSCNREYFTRFLELLDGETLNQARQEGVNE